MFCDNSVEAYLTKIGVAKAGLTVAPINPMLAPDVIAYLLEPAPSRRFAIVDAGPVAQGAPTASRDAGVAPDVTIEIGGGPIDGTVGFARFVAGAADDRARRRDPRRRRLGDHLHLGHDRDAQGRDGLPQLQLPRRLLVRADPDPRACAIECDLSSSPSCR